MVTAWPAGYAVVNVPRFFDSGADARGRVVNPGELVVRQVSAPWRQYPQGVKHGEKNRRFYQAASASW